MACDAYTGLPRSGKSYSVIKNVIMPSLQESRNVYTNIPLTDAAQVLHPGQIHQLEKEWFIDRELFAKFPPGSVVVLDELWRRWPSGLKSNNAIFADKEFLAEHGHNVDDDGHTTRVVLVTQDLSQISSWVRDLVDKTYRSTKLDAAGADDRFRVDIYQGSVTGQRPPKSQLISTSFDKYEEKVWRYYQSATQSKTGTVGNEKRADKRATVWRSPGFIVSMVFSALALIVGPWMAYNYVAPKLSASSEVDPGPVQAPPLLPLPATHGGPVIASTVAAPVAPAVPAQPSLSGNWRIGGIIKAKPRPARGDVPSLNDGGNSAYWLEDTVLLTSMFGTRYVPLTDCAFYPPGVQVYCDVDGERVTSWSGQQKASSIAPNPVEVAGTVIAPIERSESGATTLPAPVANSRLTIIEDTSRTPRTLSGS